MIHGWLRTIWRLEDDFQDSEICVFFDKEAVQRGKYFLSIKGTEGHHLRLLMQLTGLSHLPVFSGTFGMKWITGKLISSYQRRFEKD